jgi:hypothetical protein
MRRRSSSNNSSNSRSSASVEEATTRPFLHMMVRFATMSSALGCADAVLQGFNCVQRQEDQACRSVQDGVPQQGRN